jgi:hypothetical protein
MTNKEKFQLRRKWRRWLEHIGSDLGQLLTSYDIYEDVLDIANKNKKIQDPNLFLNWIVDNYAVRVAIGIRRLTDPDRRYRRAISLYRLIEDILDHPQAVTRRYYISRYRNKRLVQAGFADRDFNNFANRGSDLVNKYKLTKDMKRLERATDRIRKFTNKWFAHCDLSRRIRHLPTFADAKESLGTIDRIFCKYHLLLTRGGLRTRKPVLQYDWKEPLRHPWIEENS